MSNNFLPFFGAIYICISVSLSIASELFCSEFLETFVISLTILLPIKSQVASGVF